MIKRTISIGVGVLGLVAGCGGSVADPVADGTARQASASGPNAGSANAPPGLKTAGVPNATITIDGVKCGDGKDQNPWLEPANEGRWILNLEGPACNVLVQVSGDTAKGFPQSGADAWEGQPIIKIFKAVPNSEHVSEHLLSHESKPGSEATIVSGGKHVVAHGKVVAWQGFEQPNTHEVVVDFTIP